MKRKIITTLFMIVFLMSSGTNAANQAYTNRERGDTAITIDGDMADWAGINSVTVTLTPARLTNENAGNGTFSADFYSTHDADKIYFLIVVKDDPYYFYNYDTGINHRHAPALGIAFPIDEGAKAEYMGGTDRDTTANIELATGEVDIMHWELDTLAGVKTGGTKNTTAGASFGDGVANLDDEYAITAEDRHDDDDPLSENSYSGSWSHTSGGTANGTDGDWIFELSRDMTNADPHDAQFAEGETIDVAIAYWTPNEHSNKRWTDDGHFVNFDNVIEMKVAASSSDDSPGFGLIIAFSGIFVMAAILKKRR